MPEGTVSTYDIMDRERLGDMSGDKIVISRDSSWGIGLGSNGRQLQEALNGVKVRGLLVLA
jgi:hypothetical protein